MSNNEATPTADDEDRAVTLGANDEAQLIKPPTQSVKHEQTCET